MSWRFGRLDRSRPEKFCFSEIDPGERMMHYRVREREREAETEVGED